MKFGVKSVVCLVPLIVCVFVHANEETQYCGESLTWMIDQDTLIIMGSGDMYDYNTSLKAPWKQNCSSVVKKVNISEGVTSIGSYAFFGCSSLESVSIPEKVSSIGRSAFRSCSNLINVTIPSNVKKIGDYCFSVCKSLTNLTILEGVESIGNSAFSSCGMLKRVVIPQSVNSFGSAPFESCYNLSYIEMTGVDAGGVLFNANQTVIIEYPPGKNDTEYSIPHGVTSIGACAFASCKNLRNIYIPSSVTSIEEGAFQGSGLEHMTIPVGVQSIKEYAFASCSQLLNVTFPNGVKSIGSSAFADCSHLTDVLLPDTIESIAEKAFYGCLELQSVSIPYGVKSIGLSSFSRCSALVSVTIPDSVESIGSMAFDRCWSLEQVTIPDSVTVIETQPFSGCSGTTVYYQGTHDFDADLGDYVHVCVPPDYNLTSFCGIEVAQFFDECDDFRRKFNHCFKASYVNNTLIEQKRNNATDYESQSNGCIEYQCDNEKGPISKSTCINKEGMEYVCINSTCMEKKEVLEKGVSVEIDLTTGTEVDDFDEEIVIKKLEEGCGIDRKEVISIAWESEEGKIIRIIVFVKDESTAEQITESIMNKEC